VMIYQEKRLALDIDVNKLVARYSPTCRWVGWKMHRKQTPVPKFFLSLFFTCMIGETTSLVVVNGMAGIVRSLVLVFSCCYLEYQVGHTIVSEVQFRLLSQLKFSQI
jgi:general stress protein CsbA